jgi:ribonuclease HI
VTEVDIFTDGACKGNPGPGGWGAIVRSGAHERELSGGEPLTTNNRMEMTAAIRALQALKRPCAVTLHTDSIYLRDGITKWVHGWQKERLENRRPKAGQECGALAGTARSGPHPQIAWKWVKGPRRPPRRTNAPTSSPATPPLSS